MYQCHLFIYNALSFKILTLLDVGDSKYSRKVSLLIHIDLGHFDLNMLKKDSLMMFEFLLSQADLEVQTKTHIMAVKSIFKTLLQHVQPSGSDLCDLDSLHIQMIRTMLSFLHHMPLLLLLSWTSCCSAATTDRSLLHHQCVFSVPLPLLKDLVCDSGDSFRCHYSLGFIRFGKFWR